VDFNELGDVSWTFSVDGQGDANEVVWVCDAGNWNIVERYRSIEMDMCFLHRTHLGEHPQR
jgi:hypothetical protein